MNSFVYKVVLEKLGNHCPLGQTSCVDSPETDILCEGEEVCRGTTHCLYYQ